MKNRTLASIAILGLCGLCISGCKDPGFAYRYSGDIDGENVWFTTGERSSVHNSHTYTLAVKKSNGKVIEYVSNLGNDLVLEAVNVVEEGEVRTYNKVIPDQKPVVEQAQKDFNDYLKKILEAKAKEQKEKLAQGLEDIK